MEPKPKSRKSWPFHPICFAAFPVLSLYSANMALIPLRDVVRPLGVSCAAAFVLLLVLWPVFRDLGKGACAASIFIVAFFGYALVATHMALLAIPYFWWPLAIALAGFGAFKLPTTRVLNVLGMSLVVVAAGMIAWGKARIAFDESRIRQSVPLSAQLASGSSPDIFYIILDGYGRQDALKRAIGLNNESFVDGLKSRGFYVADRSRSNYVQTEISLASSLNLELIPDLLPDEPRDTLDRAEFDPLISDNGLARFLRSEGYRTIAITSGFPAIKFPDVDLWLRHGTSLTLFETGVLQMTPMVPEGAGIGSMFEAHQKALLSAFKSLREMAEPADRPRFFFVHVLAPHPPFVLDAAEDYVKPKGPFGYWDASDYLECCGTPATYREGYTGQLEAINTEVLKTVDRILAATRVKPIVVIQGDHGSKVGLAENDLAKTDLKECFPNLAAFYVPDTVRKRLYPTITPVNEFRIILGTLFGMRLPLLPDRSWYSPFAHPMEFTDVTAQVSGANLISSRSAPRGTRGTSPHNLLRARS